MRGSRRARAAFLGSWDWVDQHPVVILAGSDLVALLRAKGYSMPGEVTRWLSEAFPVD
jgi:hypothetical protein